MSAPGSKGMSLDEFISRKLQPVKVTINLLARMLELTDGESVRLSRPELDEVISTLEIFVEEYERVSTFKSTRGAPSRKDMVPPPPRKAM